MAGPRRPSVSGGGAAQRQAMMKPATNATPQRGRRRRRTCSRSMVGEQPEAICAPTQIVCELSLNVAPRIHQPWHRASEHDSDVIPTRPFSRPTGRPILDAAPSGAACWTLVLPRASGGPTIARRRRAGSRLVRARAGETSRIPSFGKKTGREHVLPARVDRPPSATIRQRFFDFFVGFFTCASAFPGPLGFASTISSVSPCARTM